jgi:hypothetical protein
MLSPSGSWPVCYYTIQDPSTCTFTAIPVRWHTSCTHIHIHMHVHVKVHTHTYTHIHIHAKMHTCTDTYTHADLHSAPLQTLGTIWRIFPLRSVKKAVWHVVVRRLHTHTYTCKDAYMHRYIHIYRPSQQHLESSVQSQKGCMTCSGKETYIQLHTHRFYKRRCLQRENNLCYTSFKTMDHHRWHCIQKYIYIYIYIYI